MGLVTTTAGRKPAVDAPCAAAVELARTALDELADAGSVGDHLGVEADGERVVTHLFECRLTGYVGWRWAVTVARASRAKNVTVDEMVLLPGPQSLIAPEWLPWSERLQPGDLGVGDLLPTAADDDRLEPGWNAADLADLAEGADHGDPDWSDLSATLDLTRRRVLSPLGLDDAIDRWLTGDAGPSSPMALAAPAVCSTCGFRVALLGRIGHAFGVCANAYSPSDGHVVSLDHGCGAHSEAAVVPLAQAMGAPVIDELGFDIVADRDTVADDGVAAEAATDAATDAAAETATEPVTDEHDTGSVHDADPGEELGHG